MDETGAALKLVFLGACDSGRREAMAHVAGYEPLSIAMPMAAHIGAAPSMSFDYASLWLEDGVALSVYGTPEQARQLALLGRFLQGAFGAVLMLAGDRNGWLADIHAWLTAIGHHDATLPLAIAITRSEDCADFALTPLRESLHARGWQVPVFGIDPHEPEEILHVVRALLLCLR